MKDQDIHSDALVNVEIADENEQESLMAIETDSPKEDILAICLFFVLIASTTFAGIYGPSLYNNEVYKFKFENSPNHIFRQHIHGITAQNQFYIMQLSFSVSPDKAEEAKIPISFNYLILFESSKGEELNRESGSFNNDVILQKGSATTEQLHFFFDRYISYDQIDIRIDFDSCKGLDEAILTTTYGDGSHLRYQLYLRLLFGLATLVIFILYYSRLSSIPRNKWLLEQKLTFCLQIFSFIGSNPLYFLYLKMPSVFQDIINSLFYRSFTCFVFFYILVIIDNVRKSEVIKSNFYSFFLPKIVFFSLQLICEIAYPIMYHGLSSLDVEAMPHTVVNFFKFVRILFNVCFSVWFVYLTVMDFLKVDSTQLLKVKIYATVFGATVLINLCDVFLTDVNLFRNNSGLFSLSFSSLFAFVILMVFFHWPYETSIDQQYNDPEDDDKPNNIFESDDGK